MKVEYRYVPVPQFSFTEKLLTPTLHKVGVVVGIWGGVPVVIIFLDRHTPPISTHSTPAGGITIGQYSSVIIFLHVVPHQPQKPAVIVGLIASVGVTTEGDKLGTGVNTKLLPIKKLLGLFDAIFQILF